MNFKAFLRTVIFLALLFVVVYASMHNTRDVEFSFPMAFERSIHEPAAIIYFAMFAVGVVAGTMFQLGSGGKKGGAAKEKKA